MLPKNVRSFRSALFRWYRRNGRDLPWRHTREPYPILVSEIMLQQTQVATVLSYYNRWLQRFPDFATLARAREDDVLHAWQGLGYYNRARNLHATAKIVQNQYGGVFPRDLSAIRRLPGVGNYTAHAIASFSFGQSVPIVEANTSRVLARLFNMRVPIDQAAGRNALWTNAAFLLPRGGARVHNSALTDLGALICLPQPKCKVCPVQSFCSAKRPETLPIKKGSVAMKRLTENHALVVRGKRILLRRADRRWRGMWILPLLKPDGSASKLDRLKRASLGARPIYVSTFPFTNHRVTIRVFQGHHRKLRDAGQHWFSFRRLESIPIPSPHRRAINALLN